MQEDLVLSAQQVAALIDSQHLEAVLDTQTCPKSLF